MSKIQNNNTPSVIFKSSFFDNKNPKREWMTGNQISNKKRGSKKSSYHSHLDYVGRETEAVIIESKKHVSYLGYMNQEKKITSSGHFTKDGIYSNSEMKQLIKEKRFQVPQKSLVWSSLLSFSKEFFEGHNILSKEDAHEIIKKPLETFFKDNGINPDSMEWIGQFHVDTPHHFHIHLRIHQNRPGHYDRKLKKDVWRTRGKWKPAAQISLRKNIEYEALKRTAKNNKIFQSIGYLDWRDKVKTEVLGTLQDSSGYALFTRDAKKLQDLLPNTGRLQYNSKNFKAYPKILLERLTKKILNSNSKIQDKWNKLNEYIDSPIDKLIKKSNPNSRFGKGLITSANKLRQEKHKEVFAHIANQVLKFVRTNDWGDVKRINYKNDYYKAKNVNYVSSAFRKYRTRSFKKFSKSSFWEDLENKIAFESALKDISKTLKKHQQEAKRTEMR